MEQQQCVLLYSKYSQKSKKFMDMLKQSPVDFTSTVQLNPLCIDNENVRQRILNSQQIDVTSVPCVLIIYKDGGVEKYEGGTAFKWAEEVIRSFSPDPPPIPREPPIVYQEQYSQPQPSKKSKKMKQSRQPPPPQQMQATSIDDLVSEDEEEEEEEEEESYEDGDEVREDFSNMKPPASIRSGAGNYDVQGEFGTLEEPNRSVTRGIKSSTEQGASKGSLMATAMAMQKMRDNDEPARPPGAPRQ